MLGNERGKRFRNDSAAVDAMHIVIGLAVVVLAVIAFLNPEENMILFPVIFLLAAVLNLVMGDLHLKNSKRDNRQKMGAVFQMVFGVLLVLLAVMSAAGMLWR